SSGITLGYGFDLGFYSQEEFTEAWRPHLTAGQLDRLRLAIGRTGTYAQRIAPEFADIRITPKAALEVFQRCTLPKWETLTRTTFPGVELLPLLAFGALVSLVFNRGTSMAGDQRKEMA